MKWILQNIIYLFIIPALVLSQELQPIEKLYDDSQVAKIYVEVDPAALQFMYDNPDSYQLHYCKVHFVNKYIDEWIDSVGIRIRGNTSRQSKKKSFKLSFNDLVPGREFYGVEKLNLNGEHNDPSISRSKFCWDLMAKAGMNSSRAAHAALYINNKYYGLYVSVEHIDNEFIKKRFDDASGNLWKCLWPANLEYWGDDPDLYKDASYGRRTYDLKTNTDKDDYSQLARLIRIINKSNGAEFPDSIESIINVPEVLKYFAMNVMLGSWDAYRYLKNNYYLYYSPSEDIFHWIPYDYDNTFGVDFFGVDWANINPYIYANIDDTPRPLSERLLSFPQYRNLFTHYLQFYSKKIYDLSLWESRLDSIKNMIIPFAIEDTFRTKDYDFTFSDFLNSFTDGDYSNGHVKYGIKNFVNTMNQNLASGLNYYTAPAYVYGIKVYPDNPKPEDSLRVEAAIFSNPGITKAKVLYQLGELPTIYSYDLKYNPINNNRIEDNDRWEATLPPFGGAGFATIRIYVENSSGQAVYYPRKGPIMIGHSQVPSFEVVINELLAKNDATNQDDAGEYDDWVELFNLSSNAVDLSGKYLTDDLANKTKWQFPSGSIIDPEGFMLIWCDNDSNQTGLHANFKLSASGESIALIDNDGISVLDSIVFGPQTADVSFGRYPDGGNAITFLNPTPGAPNSITSVEEDQLPVKFALSVYPNPFNPEATITYSLPKIKSNSGSNNIDIALFDLLGRKVKTLLKGEKSPGNYTLKLNSTNLSAGVYFLRLQYGRMSINKKIMLLK